MFFSDHASLEELVEAVHRLPYRRPKDRTVEGLLQERCGTCSTKHFYLFQELKRRFPEAKPRIIHRVYRLSRESACRLYGEGVARVIPQDGVVDVHRYLQAIIKNRTINIDVTFPGDQWDGASNMPLACGEGIDFPAGPDPNSDKKTLEEKYCDSRVREPFIAALSQLCDQT